MFRIGESFEEWIGYEYRDCPDDHAEWRKRCTEWHDRNRDKFEPLLLTSEGNYIRKIRETRQYGG